MNRLLPTAVAMVLTLPLMSGCVGMVMGAGASAGVATVQERGMAGSIDDTKIRADINAAWLKQDATMFRKVTLNIYEGRVMLTGVVISDPMRADAVRLTWQVPGVKEVINDIQVDPNGQSIGDYSHDTWIQEKLQSRLLFDKEIKNVNYAVDVVAGTVYLLGVAQDQTELDRVIGHASDISGVQRVVNHVILKTDPRRVSELAPAEGREG